MLGEVGVATGDDDGRVRCWDLRQHKVALEFHELRDYVADMLYTDQSKGHTLCVGGGDGHLAVFDLRAGRLWARSDPQEDEILCLGLVKRGKKLLCGTQAGVVGIFSWGNFGDVSDRMLGHPASVDCMAVCGEDMVATGSGDGLIRLVSVHPNKVLGVLGEHGDAGVEQLALNATGQVLASCGHDSTIKLYDVRYISEADDEEDQEDGEEEDSDDEDSDDDAGAHLSGGKGTVASAGSDGEDSDQSQESKPARKRAKRDAEDRSSIAASSIGSAGKKKLGQINKANAAIKLGAGFFADLM